MPRGGFNDGTVELEHIGLKIGQIHKGGISGAKIIERQLYFEFA